MPKKHKFTLAVLSGLLLISLGFNGKTIYQNHQKTQAAEHIIAHRGASGEETEHTFPAYDLAIEYGAKYIELDLVNSKSGDLYVNHDLSAKRLYNVDKFYNKMSNQEIEKLAAPGLSAPLKLEDVFKRYKNTTNYVIELRNGQDQVKKFVNLVKKYNLERKLIIEDFEYKPLKSLKTKLPDSKILMLVSKQNELDKYLPKKDIDIISADKSLMSEQNIKNIKAHDKLASFWTINSTNEIRDAINKDVDLYFTNFTDKALLIEQKIR